MGAEQRPEQFQHQPLHTEGQEPAPIVPETGQPAPDLLGQPEQQPLTTDMLVPEQFAHYEDSPEHARAFLTQFEERAAEFITSYPRGTEGYTKARLVWK